jgi:hypothetical protein
VNEQKSGDGTRKLFYLDHHPIQELEHITIDDSIVPLSEFTYDPLTGWVSLTDSPYSGINNIEFTYTYSQYPDLGVTNWNASNGNYLFSNTTGIEEHEIVQPETTLRLDVFPNPFSKLTKISFGIVQSAQSIELKIYDISGRIIKSFNLVSCLLLPASAVSWSGTDDYGKRLGAGVYLIELKVDDQIVHQKVVLAR